MASVVSGHIKTMTYTGYYKQNLVHWGICDIILNVTLNNTESINYLHRWIIITAWNWTCVKCYINKPISFFVCKTKNLNHFMNLKAEVLSHVRKFYLQTLVNVLARWYKFIKCMCLKCFIHTNTRCQLTYCHETWTLDIQWKITRIVRK